MHADLLEQEVWPGELPQSPSTSRLWKTKLYLPELWETPDPERLPTLLTEQTLEVGLYNSGPRRRLHQLLSGIWLCLQRRQGIEGIQTLTQVPQAAKGLLRPHSHFLFNGHKL